MDLKDGPKFHQESDLDILVDNLHMLLKGNIDFILFRLLFDLVTKLKFKIHW